jgi:hypothetical protein
MQNILPDSDVVNCPASLPLQTTTIDAYQRRKLVRETRSPLAMELTRISTKVEFSETQLQVMAR